MRNLAEVPDVCHRLPVGAVAYHGKAAAGYQTEKAVDISAVAFTEDDGGTDYHERPCGRVLGLPFLVSAFSK